MHAWLPGVFARALRGVLVAVVALTVFYLAVIAPARAEVRDRLLQAGNHLLRYEHARTQEAPRTFYVNSVAMELSAGITARSPTDVLDYFEAHCDDSASVVRAGMMVAAQNVAAPAAAPGPLPPGEKLLEWKSTMRDDDGERGFVACVASSGGITPESLAARARAYLSGGGDLSAFGGMRYVYATRRKLSTHYIVLWSDGKLSAADFFPRVGDVPGTDVPGVPRPPAARRLLSAREEGTPYQTAIYADTSLTVAETAAFFSRELAAGGWDVDTDAGHSGSLFASRDGVMVVVAFGERAGKVVTTVLTTDADALDMAATAP